MLVERRELLRKEEVERQPERHADEQGSGPRISETPPTQRPGNHQSSAGATVAGPGRSTPGESAGELSGVVTSV